MGEHGIMPAIAAIIASIIGLAIIAVIVSKNANTSSVINAGGSALGNVISAAVSPVAGGSSTGFSSGLVP